MDKLSLVQRGLLVPAAGLADLSGLELSTCSNCAEVWASRDRFILERFHFEVPGGWSKFLCPRCRYLVDG